MKIVYTPKGVCSKKMTIVFKENTIQSVIVFKGCNGNLQGICRLLQGMDLQVAIKQLAGIQCGKKLTSCPDQLARALRKALRSGQAGKASR